MPFPTRARPFVWKSGSRGIQKFGNLKIQKSGNLAIWKFANLEIWDPINFQNGNSQNQNPVCPKCLQGHRKKTHPDNVSGHFSSFVHGPEKCKYLCLPISLVGQSLHLSFLLTCEALTPARCDQITDRIACVSAKDSRASLLDQPCI